MFTETGLHVLPPTNQLRAAHSIIRNKDARQEDFVFYSDRIIRQLLETGMGLLPYRPLQVQTPIGATYDGLELAVKLCGVSVIRAGESMEPELRAMHPGLRMGKILIQRDKKTKLPNLLYSHLPPDIAERHVLLLEPMLATGGSALVAVEVLLKAGVPEENIIFINLLGAPVGVKRLLKAHPKLRIVTSSVERDLTDQAFMIPGIGDFGDRYFGTAG
jgi:uracil phosphoribosyltransferase